MRHKLLSIASVALIITGCSDNYSVHNTEDDALSYAHIEFTNYVSGLTRASKSGVSPFVAGESMGVWGYQTTGEYTDTIFNNQKVDYVADNQWTYDNKKLWNIGSTYKFYGVFPYSADMYSVGDENKITITGYVNPSDPAQQKDIMISEMRPISPFNMVDMLFHHIMSNVNILVKISDRFDITDVSGVTLLNMHVSGIKNTGTYTQTSWTSKNMAQGEWSDQCGEMEIADFKNIQLDKNTSTKILDDYVMIPQQLFSRNNPAQDVTIDAAFRVIYKDGTSSTFNKTGIRLANITHTSKTGVNKNISSWEANYRYNYTLAFNPALSTRTWDADGDGSLIIDPETGDTITNTDDTPTAGTMQYDPDKPSVIKILEDTDGDGTPDTWVEYPIVWEDIDDDGLLEAGIDRDGDGKIDNVDGDNITNQNGNPHTDPTDGNPNNPEGKDVILVKVDTDGDGTPDTWVQLELDPETGEIHPVKETVESIIEFTATVQDWDDMYNGQYEVKNTY